MKAPSVIPWFALRCLAGLAVAGCVPGASSRPVTLQRGGKQLSVELVQNGRQVAPSGGVWRLKASPFEIRLSGDVRWASYHAAVGNELAGRLAALDRPLVFFAGTASPGHRNSLNVLRGQAEVDEAAELFTADDRFFIKRWGAKEEQAVELAARLRRELGSAPAIACFGHAPFPSGDSRENPRYFLQEVSGMGGERLRGSFRVDVAGDGGNERSFTEFPRLHLLIFLESPIDREFRRVSWSLMRLEFGQ